MKVAGPPKVPQSVQTAAIGKAMLEDVVPGQGEPENRADTFGLKISENNRGEVWISVTCFLAPHGGESVEELARRTIAFSVAKQREAYEAYQAAVTPNGSAQGGN